MRQYLRKRIAERRTFIDGLHRQIEVAQGELRAYEDALAHADADVNSVELGAVGGERAPTVSRRRPPPPQVSHWPALIARLSARGETFSIDDVGAELQELGKPNTRKSIRAKLATLVEKQQIIRTSDGVFTAPKRDEAFSRDANGDSP